MNYNSLAGPLGKYWYADHNELARLWRHLTNNGQCPTCVAYFLEKPWKWEPEYRVMQHQIQLLHDSALQDAEQLVQDAEQPLDA